MTASLDPARPQERSRLAWRRTALAVGSLALIVVRLVAARHTGGAIVLGAIVIAIGFVAGLGARRARITAPHGVLVDGRLAAMASMMLIVLAISLGLLPWV